MADQKSIKRISDHQNKSATQSANTKYAEINKSKTTLSDTDFTCFAIFADILQQAEAE
jgi:hypothetical protein